MTVFVGYGGVPLADIVVPEAPTGVQDVEAPEAPTGVADV